MSSSSSAISYLPPSRRIIPDLISIILSFLDRPEFPPAIRVSKDWNRASRLPSASPLFDVARFISANRFVEPHPVDGVTGVGRFYFHHNLARRFQVNVSGYKSTNYEMPGLSYRFTRALSILITVNDSWDLPFDSNSSRMKLSAAIESRHAWSHVTMLSISCTAEPQLGWTMMKPCVQSLMERLEVLIVDGAIFGGVELPNCRVLKCHSVPSKVLEKMYILESIHLRQADETVVDVLHTLSLTHSLREIIIEWVPTLPDLSRRLFHGKELPLRHLDLYLRRSDTYGWMDWMELLPAITSIGCSDQWGWPITYQNIENRTNLELIKDRIAQLKEMKVLLSSPPQLGNSNLGALIRLDLLYVGMDHPQSHLTYSFLLAFMALRKLEHVSIQLWSHGHFTLDAIRPLVQYCKELRTLNIRSGNIPPAWCDESIALLSTLPYFQRWTIMAIAPYHRDTIPSDSTRQFELSTHMLRSISSSPTFHAIEFQYAWDSVPTWRCQEKTDTQLTPDLDYDKLRNLRVYIHNLSNSCALLKKQERIYSISQPFVSKKSDVTPLRRWLDQFGAPRTPPQSKCSVM